MGMRVDALTAPGAIRSPNLVKIDTDGVELPITSGMKTLLTGQTPAALRVGRGAAGGVRGTEGVHEFGREQPY
jgi:hypothetical protein